MPKISRAAILANYRLYWHVEEDDSYWPLVVWKEKVVETMYPRATITSVCLSRRRLQELLPTAEKL